MKNLFFLFIALNAYVLSAKDLKAYLSYASFNSPTQGPYIETYLSAVGRTIKFVPTSEGKYQGMIEISIAFSQENQIKNFKKYTLLSPEITDTVNGIVNFIDQQRFFLPNGSYEMEIEISDKNTRAQPFKNKQTITVDYPDSKVSISDIEFIESIKKAETPTLLTKSGYDLVPYISNYYPDNMTKLSFYAEAYNVNKSVPEGDKYLLSYYIQNFESQSKVANYSKFSKEVPQAVQIAFGEFAIDELPTGNYELVIETRNKENELLASKKAFFQRRNVNVKISNEYITSVDISNSFVSSINSRDTLAEYIRTLRPISTQLEITFAENQIKNGDLLMMQKFFLNFWKTRDPLQAEQKWFTYNDEVKKVQRTFGTQIKKGYMSDRGRIYLKYGPPDNRNQYPHEPSAYPHEIWQYYKLGIRTNRKFVFYNPDLVTNDYTLLHSDMQGELNDDMWQKKLYKRDDRSREYDSNTVDPLNPYGRSATQEFEQPH